MTSLPLRRLFLLPNVSNVQIIVEKYYHKVLFILTKSNKLQLL